MPWFAAAQEAITVPHLIRMSGTISGAPAGNASVLFALYKDQIGGAPLWQEVQSVALDSAGRYSTMLGAKGQTGLPVELFASNEARWLGIHIQGEPEQPRVLLVSVPYALKAADAETLGGLPASAFLHADAAAQTASYINTAALASAASQIGVAPAIVATGASIGSLPVFTDATGDMGNSLLFQSGGNIGIGTTSPAFPMHFVSQGPSNAVVAVDGYGATTGVAFVGRHARGTLAVPTALLANDNIFTIQGRGYYSSADGSNQGFTPSSRVFIKMFAAENWTDTAQGAYISFATTPIGTSPGTSSATEKVRITDKGYVGIGTTTPAYPLTVAGAISSTSGGFIFPDGTTLATANVIGVHSVSGSSSITVGGTSTVPTIAVATGGIVDANVHDVSVAKVAGAAGTLASNIFTLPQTINTGATGNSALALEADGSSLGDLLGATTTSTAAGNVIHAKINSTSSYGNAVLAETTGGGYALVASAVGYGTAIHATVSGNNNPFYPSSTAIVAENAAIQGNAVEGILSGTSGNGFAVLGVGTAGGPGIGGMVEATSGTTNAIYASVKSAAGTGIIVNAIGMPCNPFCSVGGGTGETITVGTGGTLLTGQVENSSYVTSPVFRVNAAGKGYFDGGTQTGGADFAESVDVEGVSSSYSPGDLMTVDPDHDRQFRLVTEPYSTLVAGIYATKPGVLATPHTMDDAHLASEVPLAIVGIVPCKVTAENGAIRRGDLLVSSSRSGYAMKGTDRNRMFGAVVGKALGSLESGSGVVEVLVTLQ